VSPRARTYAIVAALALAAAGAVVGGVLATRTKLPPAARPRAGKPPFVDDSTAPAALARQVRAAVRATPADAAARLRRLAQEHPASGLVRLELGLALYWLRRDSEAVTAWREAARVQPDSPSAVHAQDLLHPDTPRGLPPFVPTFAPPARGPVQELLLRGAALQSAQRPVSAERAFAAAAARAPRNPEAQVAAAVGLYDKNHPERAFSRLGPLTKRFPHAQTVRFHLGILLIYLHAFAAARRQFLLARAQRPDSRLGKAADAFLQGLATNGTRAPQK
jgi:tetratricopeptide (TPR) repeat protein